MKRLARPSANFYTCSCRIDDIFSKISAVKNIYKDFVQEKGIRKSILVSESTKNYREQQPTHQRGSDLDPARNPN